MKKVIIGGVIGGIILYFWGFVSWVILPWHEMTVEKFRDEELVSQIIKENAPKDGVYFIPSMIDKAHLSVQQKEEAQNKQKEAMEKGPFVYAQIKTAGMHSTSVSGHLLGILTYVVGAFLASALLVQAPDLHYFGRLFFVIIVGLLIGIMAGIPNVLWFGAPFKYYTVVMIADSLISWCLAGLALAAIVKPSHEHEHML